VRGEIFSGEDLGGIGMLAGRVMGRGRKGLTYLGGCEARSGRAGAVAKKLRVGGSPEDACVKKGLAPELRVGGCPSFWWKGNVIGCDDILAVNEVFKVKDANFEGRDLEMGDFKGGVQGWSGMLTLLLVGGPGVQRASSMVADRGTGVHGLSGMWELPSISWPGGRGGNHRRGRGPICCAGLYDNVGAFWGG
jgi:hypothetical protein